MKNKIINFIHPKLIILDTKITTLIPNPKLKKVLYIGVGSLFGFMFLIIILGIILSPFRKDTQSTNNTVLNKPNILSSSPTTQVELSETQKQLLKLETQIREMRFPQSILNLPTLESNIEI